MIKSWIVIPLAEEEQDHLLCPPNVISPLLSPQYVTYIISGEQVYTSEHILSKWKATIPFVLFKIATY